ncbi:Selenocysteine insertion sequence-binding protein 2 [Araneus ventricosus]|uniref:Selenocysteine insertion sequence-binding protein 2 n=1 Tax=Araneus ventricosus TaxID=182803 RepID=A0A4Y2BZA7_ARAVE|nr:Selenocysteine insertion sequence-binding protein 2 [Araneus ventricosus]
MINAEYGHESQIFWMPCVNQWIGQPDWVGKVVCLTMDKTKSLKGVIKVIKPEKQVLPSPHCHSADKDKHFFQVEENDFPSLSEVRDKNPKSEKESSAYSATSLSYSSKLKTLLVECASQNMKFENVRHSEPKVESVSSKGLSKNEFPLSQVGGGRHIVKPPQSVQPNRQSLAKQSSSAMYNVVPSSSKKSADSKLNSSFSEVRNKKSESFSGRTNMKAPYGHKSVNDNRSSKTAHGESNTFERIGHSPKKGHNLHASTSTNVQKPPFSKSLSSPRKTNAAYSSALRSDMLYKKENDRPNISEQHKRHVEASISVNSRAGSGQGVRLSQVNVMHSNVSGNTSNKARILSSSGSQMANNSVKTENNKTGNQSLNAQSSLPGPSETKKKKKRKSKLKRQAALQTGKILFLTPEVHSKIISQSNNVCVQRHQNVLTNINDNEEYPELGLAEPKTVKKTHATVTDVHTKEENPSNLIAFGSEIDKKENLLLSKDSSTNDNFEAATKSDKKNKAPIEKSEGEKSTIHSNNPITLSLFDMLVSAKPRRKELEKKDESTDENNSSAKLFKKEMIKKNVPQAVNPLASSKPTIKRGKEREKPKVKRTSRMRKLILLERQLRKENMAMKKHEAEDDNQEKSEEILPEIHSSHDINDFSAHDNLETCDENLLNYVADNENSSETYEIYDDVNNKTSELFALDREDVNFQSVSKNQDLSEQSKLINKLLNNTNQTLENHTIDFSNIKNDFNSISDSVADIQNDLVSNPASNLTDNEKHFVEDLVDINTIEGITEICSSIRNVNEKYSDLKNSISNAGCIDGNLMENDKKTENSCNTYNFINKMQESNYKETDLTENIIHTTADCNINTKIEVNSQKRDDSTESKQSNRNLDSSEKVVSNISANSFSDQERLKATKLMLHSRKFRPYCNHFISKQIDQAVFSLIDDLARFQDRMYQKDPVKAKIRRRLVYGIKEIKKHMKLKKVKCIIIATDIEDVKIEGGLNDSLGELISLAEAYLIPCVFSHRRFNLGKVCRKSVPVSCVGIFNYEGSEKNFKKMIELHDDSKHDYLEVTKKLSSELTNDQVKELFEAEKESILFVREVSQRILREKVYFIPEGYRNNETTELLEKSTNIESENSIVVSTQPSEDSNLLMNGEKSLSFIEECSEELKKLVEFISMLLEPLQHNPSLVTWRVVLLEDSISIWEDKRHVMVQLIRIDVQIVRSFHGSFYHNYGSQSHP